MRLDLELRADRPHDLDQWRVPRAAHKRAGFPKLPFVVRDNARHSDILYQQSVATYPAYNNYPNDGTGKSLYEYNSAGGNTMAGTPRAVKVPFNRPFSGNGSGDFLRSDSLAWEYYFIRWLERSGYDVSYSTDVDTHENGSRLLKSKAFLSVGHDEYWSKEMYDAVEQARDAGIHLGFFGEDTVSWQFRFEPSPSIGAADRVMVCYKDRSIRFKGRPLPLSSTIHLLTARARCLEVCGVLDKSLAQLTRRTSSLTARTGFMRVMEWSMATASGNRRL